MFDLFFISSVVVLVLLVWFESEAFIEYVSLINGEKFFHVTSYKENQKTNPALTYHEHLLKNNNSFFIRLINCPLCSSLWVTLIATLAVTGSLWFFPICNVLSLVVYLLMVKILEL